jgi:hypothetical protein
MVSHPSARELDGTWQFVANVRMSAGVASAVSA